MICIVTQFLMAKISFAAPLAVGLKVGPLARLSARAHSAFLNGIDTMGHVHKCDVYGCGMLRSS